MCACIVSVVIFIINIDRKSTTIYKNRWYIDIAPVFCESCSRDAAATCTSILNHISMHKINVSSSPWQFAPLNQLRHGRALLRNCPISASVNVGYTAPPELWIALASSHDRRHKNPDEPASPTARASKAARIQSARLFLKIELDRGPFTEYI